MTSTDVELDPKALDAIDELIELNVIGGTDDYPVVNRAGLIGSIQDALSAAAPGPDRSEAYPCQSCGGPTLVWFAPNDLWNLVMGGPEARDDPGGFMCPNCFIRRAEAAGIVPTAWIVSREDLASRPTGEGADEQIHAALNRYVDALVRREHGGLANASFVDEVASILGRNPTSEMDARRKLKGHPNA
jgi:hypothetical protein